MTIASGETLDQAARGACEKMYAFLEQASELDACGRITLLSLVGHMEICQIVNPLATARMTIPAWVAETCHNRRPHLTILGGAKWNSRN